MKRILCFAYGLIAYAIFFGTFLYASFVASLLVPKSIDAAPSCPIGGSLWQIGTPTAVLLLKGLSMAGFLLVLISTFTRRPSSPCADGTDTFATQSTWAASSRSGRHRR